MYGIWLYIWLNVYDRTNAILYIDGEANNKTGIQAWQLYYLPKLFATHNTCLPHRTVNSHWCQPDPRGFATLSEVRELRGVNTFMTEQKWSEKCCLIKKSVTVDFWWKQMSMIQTDTNNHSSNNLYNIAW